MAKTLLLLLCSVGLLSCYEGGGETHANQIACTLMASDNALIINLISATPIPDNLAVSINGDDIDIDECENETYHSLRFNEDRTSVIVYFSLNVSPDDYRYYFENVSEDGRPMNEDLTIRTFNRSSCAGPIGNGSPVEELSLNWKPVHANGVQCGITSHRASTQLVR